MSWKSNFWCYQRRDVLGYMGVGDRGPELDVGDVELPSSPQPIRNDLLILVCGSGGPAA